MPEAIRLDIYGPITSCPWDSTEVCARQVIDSLKAADGAPIEVHINSPGGDAFEGMAIANALRAYKGKTTAIIDGICASAATMAAVACGEVRMHEASLFMIHEASTLALGFAEDLEKQATLLRQINDVLADMYERKTGAAREQIEKWMSEETWFTPAEALAAKFCDAVLKQQAKIDNRVFGRVLNSYRNVPAHLRAPAPATEKSATPSALLTPPKQRIKTHMDKKQIISGLAAALALAFEYAQAGADSGDAELAAACTEMLGPQALPLCSAKLQPIAQLEGAEPATASVKDMLAIVATAQEVTGAKEGICGALEALKRNVERKAGVATASLDTQITEAIQVGVKQKRILPADGERYRAEIKSGRRTLADLKSFIRLAPPAGDISDEEIAEAKPDATGQAQDSEADDEPAVTEADFARAANFYKIGGAK